jgi:hypothetical protein
MRNVADNTRRENQTTLFMFSNFFQKFCHLRVRDNAEKYGRVKLATDDTMAWHLCFACWLTEAKDTHSM